MKILEIREIVKNALEGASPQYLDEILHHGIHNLTNDYHGDTNEDYLAFQREFETLAREQYTESQI